VKNGGGGDEVIAVRLVETSGESRTFVPYAGLAGQTNSKTGFVVEADRWKSGIGEGGGGPASVLTGLGLEKKKTVWQRPRLGSIGPNSTPLQ